MLLAIYTCAGIKSTEKTMKDWFKYIRKRSRITAWNAHVATDTQQSGSVR